MEQQQIVEFLEKEITKNDLIVSKLNGMIKKFEDVYQSIIPSAISAKIDVQK